MRKLTATEVEYLENLVDIVKELGGRNIKTRDIHDKRFGVQDSYTRSYSQRSTAKLMQKADAYGYLDVEWDGRTFRASIK